jgi:hypothetical protein
MSGEAAVRHNQGKLELSKIFYWLEIKFLMAMVAVMFFGSKKYAKDNWKKGMPVHTCLDSALRHINEVINGENLDKEAQEKFGLQPTHHLAHAAVNCMFAFYMLEKEKRNG